VGADDVVLHRLAGVELHERHVLVGGSVEDELRAMAAEGMLHAATIRHVGDGDFQGTARATRLQLGATACRPFS